MPPCASKGNAQEILVQYISLLLHEPNIKTTDPLDTSFDSEILSGIRNAHLAYSGVEHKKRKKIIVAGAGVSGLSFVVSLGAFWTERNGEFPEIWIYDREHGHLDASREGYSMSISSHEPCGGIQVLRDLNLLDELRAVSIPRKGRTKGFHGLWTLDWRRVVPLRHRSPTGLPTSCMRTTRANLRRVLLKAASQYADIVWSVSCTEAKSMEDGRIRVSLSDGTCETCDWIICADGANSKLRTCVRPNDKLHFAGAVSIAATSRFPGPPPKPVDEDWGIVMSGQGVALFASPMTDKSASWAVSYIADEPRKELRPPESTSDSKELLREARERGSMFKEPFRTLLEHTDEKTFMVFNAMDKMPFAHGPSHGVPQGIVFIGDSNHAVSPFTGNGANLALRDGYDLAKCFCKYGFTSQAVETYDGCSMSRASSSIRKSHLSIAVVHSSGISWIFCQLALRVLGWVMSFWQLCMDTVKL